MANMPEVTDSFGPKTLL